MNNKMTPKEFRLIALSFPETAEESHMGHQDFRVKGKIFATLGPEEDWGMVKLTPEQQAPFAESDTAFSQRTGGQGHHHKFMYHSRAPLNGSQYAASRLRGA